MRGIKINFFKIWETNKNIFYFEGLKTIFKNLKVVIYFMPPFLFKIKYDVIKKCHCFN